MHIKSDFELLKAEVEAGLSGRNSGIPMGFDRLSKYIGIRKSTYTLVGGYTGSAKTTYIDQAYVLSPIDWYIENAHKMKTKIKILYWSMERKKVYKLARWISRKIFLDEGIILPIGRMLGWNDKMSSSEKSLFDKYEGYVDQLFKEGIITMFEGPTNVTGIYKQIKLYAEGNKEEGLKGIGEMITVDKYNNRFVEYDEDLMTIIIIDHAGLLVSEKGQDKKEAIDKLSEHMRNARDRYGFIPTVVSQFNRSISNPMRIKNGDVEPQMEDFAETATTQHDADIVLSLFDPMRYNVADTIGYDLTKLRGVDGSKRYRSIKVLKNSFNSDDIKIGVALQPEVGVFKEMPRLNHITETDYKSIVDNFYFLK